MDKLLILVLTRLLRVYDEFGEASFQKAAHRALLGIGAAAKDEAERRSPPPSRSASQDRIIPFPLGRTAAQERRDPDSPGGGHE